MRVIYSLSDSVASKLRTAADEGGVAGVLDALISAYEELYDAGIIDIDDYEQYVEEVHIVDPDDIDEAEYQLQEFFDLCDNIGIFIPVIYEEVSLEESAEPVTEDTSDGWDDELIFDIDGADVFGDIEGLIYEIKNTYRGYQSGAHTYKELSEYISDLASGLSYFAEGVSRLAESEDNEVNEGKSSHNYEDDSMNESFHGKWEIDTALRIAQEIGLNTLKDLRDFLKNEAKPGESEFDTLLRYRAELGNDFQIKESASEEFDDVDHINVVDIPEESDNAVKAEPCCQQPSKTVKVGENDIDIGVDFEADDIDA